MRGKRKGRGRGLAALIRTPSTSHLKPLDGLYEDGKWYCKSTIIRPHIMVKILTRRTGNCQERQEAKHLQVQKRNRNRGRWFYTCPTRRGGCDFFLWEDDAKARETMTPIVSPPQEPRTESRDSYLRRAFGFEPFRERDIKVQNQIDDDDDDEDSLFVGGHNLHGSLFFSSTAAPQRETQRRSRPTTPINQTQRASSVESSTLRFTNARVLRDLFSDDDDLLGDISSDEERQLLEAATESSRKARNPFVTPTHKRTYLTIDGLPTPQTKDLPRHPESKRQRVDADVGIRSSTTFMRSPPAITPTSNNTKAVMLPVSGDDFDVTKEVMDILRSQDLDPVVATKVRETLNLYSLKSLGIARGRDMVRSIVQAKDQKISQLQERVVALENTNKQQRNTITNFKTKLNKMFDEEAGML
jgi:hypothetical protein